ncbi:MAG: hypothetical protein QGI83_02285, partial [Candidatus Latescibacteria bacterium]|nr:hypothetical protein [Candidatus Latescibacterota bacterium]
GTPTGLIHLEADAETASEGFASLLVPFCGRTPPPDTGIDAVTKQPDGSVTVEFRIDGERRRVAMTG